jgi:hypothetical protein
MDKSSSLLRTFVNYSHKSFITLGPGPKVIKLFTVVICNKVEFLFISRHFQASLMFVGKARSLPYSTAPESFFNRIGSCFTNKH